MADPHLLYIVTAVVVLALVAWVIVVLARAPVLPPAPPKGDGTEPSASPPPRAVPEEPKPAASKAEEPKPAAEAEPPKSRLDAHLEIQDEKDGGDAGGKP